MDEISLECWPLVITTLVLASKIEDKILFPSLAKDGFAFFATETYHGYRIYLVSWPGLVRFAWPGLFSALRDLPQIIFCT